MKSLQILLICIFLSLTLSSCVSHDSKSKWTKSTLTDGEYEITFSKQPNLAFHATLLIHDCGNLQMIIYSEESGVTNNIWLGGSSDNEVISIIGDISSEDQSSSVFYDIQCSKSNAYFGVEAKNSENKIYNAETPWNSFIGLK